MGINGVALFDEDLAARLERASAAQQRAAALAAARFALTRHALDDAAVSDAMDMLAAGTTAPAALAKRLQDVVHSLDDIQWDLQEQVDAGHATEAEQLAAFEKARAANAILAAVAADPLAAASESVYEAYYATSDLAGLRAVILAALSAGG